MLDTTGTLTGNTCHTLLKTLLDTPSLLIYLKMQPQRSTVEKVTTAMEACTPPNKQSHWICINCVCLCGFLPPHQEHRGLLSVRYPMEHGIVNDWNDMERIWQYVYSKEQLQTFSEEVGGSWWSLLMPFLVARSGSLLSIVSFLIVFFLFFLSMP